MLGFIGGVLLGSVATLITMCMLIAGKDDESENELFGISEELKGGSE